MLYYLTQAPYTVTQLINIYFRLYATRGKALRTHPSNTFCVHLVVLFSTNRQARDINRYFVYVHTTELL